VLVYFAAAYILANPINKVRFVKWLFILIGLFSLYAIIQYFTRIGLPLEWWGNADEPKRALSIFEYPNAFALYLAPLLAFLLPYFFEKNLSWFYKACYAIGVVGLLLSLSRGGWAGLAVAGIIYILVFADNRIRKTIAVIAIALVVIIAAVPNLRYRVTLPFKGEKSTVSRYSLWHTADKMIKDSPLLGKGLYGYKTYFDQYNTDPNLSSLDFPHNIFLNFWVETGLLGLLSFIGISVYFKWRAWKSRGLIATGIILFLVALYIHGLVDAPYMKNDLALMFWIIMGLL
jgi:O-antigen ligase